MQQHTRRLAIVFLGGLLAIVGFEAACSTDNGAQPLPGQNTPKGDDDGDDDDDDDDDIGVDEAGAKDAGPDCSTVPKIRNNEDGVFCFGGTGSDDAGLCSGAGEICCADERLPAGGFVKAKCEVGSCTFNDPDAGGREWKCTQKSHCPGADDVCCMIGSKAGDPRAGANNDYPGCTNAKYINDRFVGGTECRADSCEAGELTLCSTDADCPKGKCFFAKAGGRQLGVCQ